MQDKPIIQLFAHPTSNANNVGRVLHTALTLGYSATPHTLVAAVGACGGGIGQRLTVDETL
jgi:hypothetical protein